MDPQAGHRDGHLDLLDATNVYGLASMGLPGADMQAAIDARIADASALQSRRTNGTTQRQISWGRAGRDNVMNEECERSS